MRIYLLITLVTLAITGTAHAARAQASLHMSTRCAGTQRDPNWSRDHPHETPGEVWVNQQFKPFLPKTGAADSLRLMVADISVLQTVAAYDGINQVCASYRAGKTPEDIAENTLAGFEQTLRDFIHDMGNQVQILTRGGQVSQMQAIRNAFGTFAAVGRQMALMGKSPRPGMGA